MTSDRGLLLLRVSGWYGSFVEGLLAHRGWPLAAFDPSSQYGAGVAEVLPGLPGLHGVALRPPVKL